MASSKIVLVTGGTRGIGAAVARALVAQGHHVTVTSRSGGAPPEGAHHHALDVCDPDSVRALLENLETRYGRLDAVLNNAGVGLFKPLAQHSLDDWRRVLDTNLTGAFLVTQSALPLLRASGGRIVHIGSIAGVRTLADNGAYGVSKHGLRALSGILNEEYRDGSVASTYVTLGATYTEVWHGREGFDRNDMLPLQYVGEELARLLLVPANIRYEEVTLLPPKGVL